MLCSRIVKMFMIGVVALLFAPLVVGHDDQLETECNIKLTGAETLINQLTTEGATLRKALIIAETEIANLKQQQTTQTPQTTEPSRTDCLAGWIEFQGSCYVSIIDGYSFQDAQVKCQELGARLIHLETETENTFIKNYLATLATGEKYWIGLDDNDVEGIWKWTGTDSVAIYTDWAPTEPSSGFTYDNCGYLMPIGYDYLWNGESCTHENRPLCERLTLFMRDTL